MPSRFLLNFKKDLTLFVEANNPILDIRFFIIFTLNINNLLVDLNSFFN